MKTILITGGAGYIGSHVCLELIAAGYSIVVVDNYMNSSPESLLRVRKISGTIFPSYDVDLMNEKDLSDVFSRYPIDAVIHLAGLKAVGESVALPLKYYRNNIVGTIVLCEVMQKFRVKQLVFSSSATVYGNVDTVPIREDAPIRTTNPYGRTKAMIEEILRDLVVADPSFSVSLLRYFNPIGAHHSGLIGEDPKGIPNNLIPYITQVAVGRLQTLQVFGNDYDTPDGTGVRDYIHVCDLAAGHVKALDHVLTHTGVEAYNLGTGQGYSVLEIIHAFEKIAGRKIPYIITDKRAGDIAECYADPSKAAQVLQWVATRGIEQMVKDSWRWQLNNPHGYN